MIQSPSLSPRHRLVGHRVRLLEQFYDQRPRRSTPPNATTGASSRRKHARFPGGGSRRGTGPT